MVTAGLGNANGSLMFAALLITTALFIAIVMVSRNERIRRIRRELDARYLFVSPTMYSYLQTLDIIVGALLGIFVGWLLPTIGGEPSLVRAFMGGGALIGALLGFAIRFIR